ncbi:MAG TPA: MBL fold metallo-hydrolase [bacterium]|nr:MBL fold metallo-hydrolase [bacterium]
MKILFIGHDTFRITLAGGTTLLTDPWFKNSPIWRKVAPALGPHQIGKIDYMLSSHNHLDHIDAPSLALAKEQGSVVIGSKRVARRALRSGISNTVALAPGEEENFPAFLVQATPAFHPLAKDAIGFLIRADGKQIYFSGDTRQGPALVKFIQQAGAIDIAFLQVECARYFGKDDGLDQDTAAELAISVQPRLVIPMHLHATFKKPADLSRFQQSLAAHNIESLIMKPGEQTEV